IWDQGPIVARNALCKMQKVAGRQLGNSAARQSREWESTINSRWLLIPAVALSAMFGHAQPLGAQMQNQVTAIDILLDPDNTMVKSAVSANERLLKVFPKGFALGTTHAPHISILQRYVNTPDLEKVYDAVEKVWVAEKPTGWKLKAYKYYYIPWKNI